MKKFIILAVLIIFIAGEAVFMLFQMNNKPEQVQQTPVQNSGAEKQAAKTCNNQPTKDSIEGPYYKSGSPETTNLRKDGIPGTPITLSGQVTDTNCEPVARAWVDFWQADGNGQYDNSGYTLRGHQFTDENGKYTLTTVVPGIYPGRTPHFHVKVRATDSSPVLTTQLYLPGEEKNSSDAIFTSALLTDVQDTQNGKTATFNFVVAK